MEENENNNKIDSIKNKVKRIDSLKKFKKSKEKKKKNINNQNSNNSTEEDSTQNNNKLNAKKVTFKKNISIVKIESWKKYNLENTIEEQPGNENVKYKKNVHCKCIIF